MNGDTEQKKKDFLKLPDVVSNQLRDIDTSNRSDEELLLLARPQCSIALATLFERYQDRLFRYVRKRLGQHNASGLQHSAEDIGQEVLCELVQSIDRYQNINHFQNSMYKRATWRINDLFASFATRPMSIDAVDIEQVAGPDRDVCQLGPSKDDIELENLLRKTLKRFHV